MNRYLKRRKTGIPIYDDVLQGRGGIAGGKFVMNDVDGQVDLGALLIDDSGGNFLLQTEDGTKVLIS